MADSLPELEAQLAAARLAPAEPIALIDALLKLAWFLRNDAFSRANELASEAYPLARAHGYKLGQARAARTMAMTIRNIEGMSTLFRLAEEAKELFDEVGEPLGRAGSRDFLSSIYEHIGELTVALDLALDALSIARAAGDPLRQGYALSSVGGVLAASGEVDAGVERLEEALKLFESIPALDGVSTICTRLCRIHRQAGRSAEALKYAVRCRDIAALTQNEWPYATAISVMAELEEERGDLAEAERLYRAALEPLSSEAIRNMLGGGIQVSLGRLLIKRGAFDDAEHELQDALRRIEGDLVSIVGESGAHDALAELYEKRGELAKAIVHLRKSQGLRDQIAQRDSKNKLTQVAARANMEAAKKDAEIHKLRFVELHGMQSKLIEAEKMALLGTLAAGASHELNSPLGVLSSNNQLASTALERLLVLVRGHGALGAQAEKLAAVLEACRQSTDQAIERLSSVAMSFRRFTQLDQAELRAFDVREGLESALALLAPVVPKAITIERRFDPVPPIKGWPRALNQAFMTVLENAIEAIDGDGVVTAETATTPDRVLVRVRDTGRGMSAEKAAHLFDMAWSEEGQRTKMRMGLSAAHAATVKHGGTIEVASVLGGGTTMTFSFPSKQQP